MFGQRDLLSMARSLDPFQSDSEFKNLLDTCKRAGIKHEINWGPTKENWQDDLSAMDYDITALACNVVTIGATDFLFINEGYFMLSRDRKGVVTKRNTPFPAEVTAKWKREYDEAWSEYPKEEHDAYLARKAEAKQRYLDRITNPVQREFHAHGH